MNLESRDLDVADDAGGLSCRPPRSRAPLYLPATTAAAAEAAEGPLGPEAGPGPDGTRPAPPAARGGSVSTSVATHLGPRQANRVLRSTEPMRRVSAKESPHLTEGQMERRRTPASYLKALPKAKPKPEQKVRMDRSALGGGSSFDEPSPDDVFRQNQELRRRLEDESSSYKRRSDSYRQAQQHQAALVSRLQAKVLQYKQRCNDLESQMVESLPSVPKPSSRALASGPSSLDAVLRDERIADLETALRRLDDERRKCEKLMELNAALRDQLEESHQTNDALTNDLQKLTNDWEQLREEMIIKEDEWKEEEQVFNDYYTTEHNRLLNLWRDVVQVKRLFGEMQSATERDLSKINSEIQSASREMSSACSGLASSVQLSSQSGATLQRMQEQEAAELKSQVMTLRSQHQAALSDVQHKEDRIQMLLRDVQGLEDRCGEAENEVGQVIRMQEEVELLQTALRDIAHAVIQDAESRGAEAAAQAQPHVHLSQPGQMPPRSPKRGTPRTPTSHAFAESTISAVQAALHKYQLQIHEMQVKLQASKEQLAVCKKQCDCSEENQATLENKLSELTSQLDASRSMCTQLSQERDMLQKSLDSAKSEKNALDKNRLEINAMLDTLNQDYEKLQKSNSKLQKISDHCEDEKHFLQSEIDRITKDGELREMNLRAEEERCSRLREELLTLREELNKVYLSRDVLESQKMECDNLISHMEKSRGDLELELERVLLEGSDGQEALLKMETICASLEQDKRKLQEDLKRTEEEKAGLQSQCADQHSDLGSLRKELLQAEQTRLDLDSDKVSLQEKCKFLEIEKEKVELELGQVSRERGDLSNQLSVLARKKEALNEELIRLRQRLEQASETNGRINRDLEDLVKDKEERQVQLETTEKELQRTQEQLASLRSEKEALEGVLFDTQSNLEATDMKRSQLEKQHQEMAVKQEALKGHVSRLTRDLESSEKRGHDVKNALLQQSGAQEAEYQQIIANLKKHNDDTLQKLTEEKEQIRVSLEKRLQATVHQLGGEKDGEIHQLKERIESLEQHIENICQQHEEVLLRAENDKQQSLLIAHHDQQALADKMEGLKRDLEEEQKALDRLRREATTRADQDRGSINQLRDELSRIKARLEESRVKGDEERLRLEAKADETRKERDAAIIECEENKVQLHLAEDRVDALQTQYQETARKLKEVENSSDNVRKELTDVRRQLTDASYEKEKYNSSNKELREYVKRIEGDKREQGRALEESFQKIAALEDAKTGLDAERNRLQGFVRDMERQQMQTSHQQQGLQEELQRSQAANAQLQTEEKELQARLACETEERERAHQEMHQLKKQIVELDGSLELARQEMGRLQSRGDEEEERWRGREQELLARLEDSRGRERKLEDQKHNLEVCLADASQQIQELKARLGGSEGRVRALEQQLMQLDAAKKDVEQKLSSVGSTLRRIAGIQLDGSVSLPYKLSSPSRRWSPARNQDHGDGRGDGLLDVDPEIVRKGIRSLMQQVAQIERERDDFKAQVGSVKRQLNEANEVHNKGESKLTAAMQNLRAMQDEKGSLEAKLGQKQAAFQAQAEALQQKTDEMQQMREKLTTLELAVNSGSEEKTQFEDKLEKMKQSLARLENEKRGLQEELGRNESRATKLELQRLSLEGDLQRLQMMLHDKDAHIAKMSEKSETQGRSLASLEERCASLKSTIDQLNLALERASSGETEMKAEIQSLQRTLLDTSATSQTSSEKLKQLQKALSNSENERRVVAERFDSTQQTITELRRTNAHLTDQMQRLNTELANNEVQRSGLESQLRLSAWTPDMSGPTRGERDEELSRQLQTTQRERSELRGKVESLSDKVRQLEAEKRSMERSYSKASAGRSKSYERPEKGMEGGGDQLDQENRELKLKIRRLESQLAEKESELARLRAQPSDDRSAEHERLRAAQLQAERLLEAREQSHRQQVLRLENQVQLLREQLNQEVKRRQLYVLRSSRAGREMSQLRQALGDSLRTVSQDPSLDAMLLEHEARKLDNSLVSATQPTSLAVPVMPRSYSPADMHRSYSPLPK